MSEDRFNFADGMAYARAFMGIKGQMDQASRDAKKKHYASKLLAGEKVDRDAPDFDYDTFLDAHVNVISEHLRDGKYDSMRQQQGQQAINKGIATAQQQIESGDEQGALNTLLPLYDHLPNGVKIKGPTEDGRGLVMVKNGEEFTEPMPTAQQALAMARGLSDKYAVIDDDFRAHRRKINMENLAKRDVWVSPDGTPAFHFVTVQPDGSVQEHFKDVKTGKTLHGIDPTSGETVDSGVQFLPFDYYKEQQGLKKGKKGLEKTDVDIANAKKSGANIEARTAATKSSQDIAEKKAPLERGLIKSRTKVADAQAASVKNTAAGKTSKAKSQKMKVAKQELDHLLRPFAGNKAAYDELGNLTDEGKTAMDSAMRLVDKYRSKQPLEDHEKSKIKDALLAVKKFRQISDDIASGDKDKGKKKPTWRDVSPDTTPKTAAASPTGANNSRPPMKIGY